MESADIAVKVSREYWIACWADLFIEGQMNKGAIMSPGLCLVFVAYV